MVKRKLPVFITCIMSSLIFTNVANARVMTIPNNDNHQHETKEIRHNHPRVKKVIIHEPRRTKFYRHDNHDFKRERVPEIRHHLPEPQIQIKIQLPKNNHWKKEKHRRHRH